ncbi:MAG: ABC transporter permease [Lachnospiraceae bacterium]|uniref:ABC transporter permease n=1 Tax=Parablautia sp. Marseille-Q6255 TaxID=3039593 RepID=UPI0024BD354C|nr:ABC transporter permease [Parablautia sp. Marseille-Q6255]
MSNNKNIKSPVDLAQERPMRVQDVPGKTAAHHAENRMEDGGSNKGSQHQEFSLNDDRRVKVLSPGALVAKRFFRNRLAVLGMIMLIVMFVFSFIGGMISPYGEDEQFYTYTYMDKEYAGVVQNDEVRFTVADGKEFGTLLQAKLKLAMTKKETSFTEKNVKYEVTTHGDDFYSVTADGEPLAVASKDIITSAGEELPYEVKYGALTANAEEKDSFEVDGKKYKIDEEGSILDGDTIVGSIGRFIVQPAQAGTKISNEFKEAVQEAINNGAEEFVLKDEEGNENTYTITYKADSDTYSVIQETKTYVYDRYANPSKAHWLGTDTNGMDMLTRLMYGGRVSLVIGFIVVFLSCSIGVVLGGVSGYFGGWIDNLIMRIVDIFYCIPSMPLVIILGAAMDAMRVDPQIRMLYLMLILGFLGWPSIARLVRGQILSLREQEFMTATEACGISIHRRIFKHLIPNVIPQLIVMCTMSLGSTIITEATLSFLGLGVKFPFASWGNIINDVNNAYVMTHYWFIWIPAGICLLITVLGFNFVGDGLRDAFDPKMKR